MPIEEAKKLIDEKEKLVDEIKIKSDELVEIKSCLAYTKRDLWLDTDWDKVIDGRPTDKTKGAYVDGELRPTREKVEFIENEIRHLYNKIDVIDDRLLYGGYDD